MERWKMNSKFTKQISTLSYVYEKKIKNWLKKENDKIVCTVFWYKEAVNPRPPRRSFLLFNPDRIG